MKAFLILAGVVLLIASGTMVLVVTGRHRYVAPYLAAALGATLVVSGVVYAPWRNQSAPVPSVPTPTPTSSRTYSATDTASPQASFSTPTAVAQMQPSMNLPAPPDSDCTPFAPGSAPNSPPPGYQGPTLPRSAQGDVQTLPTEFAPGQPAGGKLERSTSTGQGDVLGLWGVAAIAPVMQDLYGAAYDDLSLTDTGGMPFLYLSAGTPKAGTCWNELAYNALTLAFGPGSIANVHTKPVDPQSKLARYHAVLLCGQVGEAWDACAWAGPGRGTEAGVFGLIHVMLNQRDAESVTDPAMAAFAEKVFDATTPAH